MGGGVEAIVHEVNRFLEDHGDEVGQSLLCIDFRNGFNMVDRAAMLEGVKERCPSMLRWVEFLYEQPARLYLKDDFIWSSHGVQQGDPLGLLLFALALHPLILRVEEACNLSINTWYLDDGSLVGDSLEIAKAYDIIRVEGPSRGLFLNSSKSEIFWPLKDERVDIPGLFPVDIKKHVDGVKLLGGVVSSDVGFIDKVATLRAKKSLELMALLPKLQDPQSELLLLSLCVGIAKFYFVLRTCSPQGVCNAQVVFDTALRQILEGIVTGGGAGYGELQW